MEAIDLSRIISTDERLRVVLACTLQLLVFGDKFRIEGRDDWTAQIPELAPNFLPIVHYT